MELPTNEVPLLNRTQPFDLVTGGAGFLGSHLVDRLVERGRSVIAVDSFDAGLEGNLARSRADIVLIRADTRDRSWLSALEGRSVQRIFHLAANASVPRSSEDPHYDLTTNIAGTLNMLGVARDHGAQFIYISSAAVYGTPQYVPTDENHPTVPISPYGTSKLAGEHYVDLYRREHGLDTRVVRYFNSFGPRQPRYIVFDYLRKADETSNTFEVLGTGEQIRTQLYASDTIDATLLIAQDGDHLPYNVGSERAFSVRELAQKVLAITGQSHREIVTTGTSWPGDIPVLKPDISRLKGLGFEQRFTLEEGLEEVLAWWRQRPVSAS